MLPHLEAVSAAAEVQVAVAREAEEGAGLKPDPDPVQCTRWVRIRRAWRGAQTADLRRGLGVGRESGLDRVPWRLCCLSFRFIKQV